MAYGDPPSPASVKKGRLWLRALRKEADIRWQISQAADERTAKALRARLVKARAESVTIGKPPSDEALREARRKEDSR